MAARSAGNHSRSRVCEADRGRRRGHTSRCPPAPQNPPAPPSLVMRRAKGNGTSCSTVTKHQWNRVCSSDVSRGRVAALCKMVCGGRVVSSRAEVEDVPPPLPSVMFHLVEIPLHVSRGFCFFFPLDLSRP